MVVDDDDDDDKGGEERNGRNVVGLETTAGDFNDGRNDVAYCENECGYARVHGTARTTNEGDGDISSRERRVRVERDTSVKIMFRYSGRGREGKREGMQDVRRGVEIRGLQVEVCTDGRSTRTLFLSSKSQVYKMSGFVFSFVHCFLFFVFFPLLHFWWE